MTAATLTGAITEKISDFAELTLPKPSQVAVGVVDAAGRTVETLEQAMHETKRAVDETVPAVVRFVGSLVLPEIVNYQVSRVATLATTLGTTVATKGGNAMLNIATFGGPTWLKAARNTLATSNELTQSEWNSSSMFLARCMAENTSAPVIKDNLIRYIGERQELDRALTLHGDASPEVAELRARITSHEHELTSYRDFERIKEVIDQGLDYVRKNFDQIVVLAERMADKVLKRAENYYQDRLGSFGGIIEGSYKGMGSDAERVEARNELRDRIAVRLKEVFANELGSRDVTKKLQGVRSELLESFGAYREGVYYGRYSCRRRGERAKLAPSPPEEQESDYRREFRKSSWAACIKRIYEVDPLECPKCKAQMRIIAFIQDEYSIKDIMTAQGIPDFQAPPPIPKFIDTIEAIDELPEYDSFEPAPDDF